MKKELLDLVNEFDEVIGTIDRNSEEFAKTNNIRGVELFLLTEDGKVVIPKRSSNRRIYHNCYDYSVAGMVDSQEDYETAMYRELEEELGISNIKLHEIAYLNPFKNESTMFIKLYIGYINEEITNYDHDGIADIYYFTTEEIDKLLEEHPEQFKSTFPSSYSNLKKYLNTLN